MATISNTGQSLIREPIREALGLEPGSTRDAARIGTYFPDVRLIAP